MCASKYLWFFAIFASIHHLPTSRCPATLQCVSVGWASPWSYVSRVTFLFKESHVLARCWLTENLAVSWRTQLLSILGWCIGSSTIGPIYRDPIYRAPIYRAPLYRDPIYRVPIYSGPKYRVPIYRAPMCRGLIYRDPIYIGSLYL